MILHPGIKVNLGLDILRKRPDGYHDIETLFVPCDDFHDTLEVVPADDPSLLAFELLKEAGADGRGLFDVDGREQPEGDGAASQKSLAGGQMVQSLRQEIAEDGKVMMTIFRVEGVDWDPLKDLCVKAYRLLASDFALPAVKIVLKKGSPVGAGLGGGSADAACTLQALNALFALGLSDDALVAYAARLGSDCAFFIYNAPAAISSIAGSATPAGLAVPTRPRPMLGSGRGEILKDFPMGNFFDRYRIRVYIPEGISVSTAQAYAGVTPSIPDTPLAERLSSPVERWIETVTNAFEPGIVALHPTLADLKARIYADGALYASMSGSGSAFFGIFPL